MNSPLHTLVRAFAQAQENTTHETLGSLRRDALAHLETMTFPTRKTEAWKYTATDRLANETLWNTTAIAVPTSCGIGHACVVGRDPLPEGISLTSARDLDATAVADIMGALNLDVTRWQSHPFAMLANAGIAELQLLRIGRNVVVERPIVLGQVVTSGGIFQQRVIVVVEPGADITLVQASQATGTHQAFHNEHIQVAVGANAHLRHLHWQLDAAHLARSSVLDVTLARDARYTLHQATLGSAWVRNDRHVNVEAPGAQASLQGFYVCGQGQHIDNHLTLEHTTGRTESQTRYKGLLSGDGRGVFNGRIHIHPHAQKTSAHLNNSNLMLSREAEVDTKPELEIYADDVQCSHGASIGQIDNNALFYFESRGIDKAAAQAMLSVGFINEIIDAIGDDTLSAPLHDALIQVLSAQGVSP